MGNKEFRQFVKENAIKLGLTPFKSAFFIESEDSIVFLILRKSGYANYYYLRLKVKLKPLEESFDPVEYIKHDVADILTEAGNVNNTLFDLENSLSDVERVAALQEFFHKDVKSRIDIFLNRNRIIELNKSGNLFLLPFAKEKLCIK